MALIAAAAKIGCKEKAVEDEKAKGGKSPLEESLAIFIFNQTIISSFGSGGILDFIPYKPGDGA